jgi:apolipoprotein D and lipocalin family protein
MKLAPLLLLAAVTGGLILAACASSPVKSPPATAAKVDLSRYTGTWHEIARLPMPFQRDGDSATATYGANADGTLSVHNVAKAPNGEKSEIRGSAKVLNPGQNSKLLVSFNAWFSVFIPKPEQGNYWILDVDDGYQRALVGTPDRRYLWILARTPVIPENDEKALITKAQDLGYDVSRLVRPKR